MKRRDYLAIASCGCASFIAGCSTQSESTPESADGQSNDNPTDTQTSNPSPSAEASVTAAEYEIRSGENRQVGAIFGQVKNTGSERLWSVVATGKFYDADDNLLTTALAGIRDFVPGEIWDVWVRYPSDPPTNVERGELVITQAAKSNRTYFPDGFRVTESKMEVPQNDNRPIISASVENTSGVDDALIMAILKVTAENGHVLGTAITTKNSLSNGETWNINRSVIIENREWVSRATSHEVVLLR